MRTLDRYVIRSFLYSAALWFIVLISMRVVIDLFANMDEYVKKGGESPFSILVYYGYQTFLYAVEMGGPIIVAAAAFSLARMNQTNELTAMLASGVSLYRVIIPLVISAMLLNGLIIIDREAIIPLVADKLVLDRDDVVGAKGFSVPLMLDRSGTAWYAQEFSRTEVLMRLPRIEVRDELGRMIACIMGVVARPGKLEGHKGWFISDAKFVRVRHDGNQWFMLPDSNDVYTFAGPRQIEEQMRAPQSAPAAGVAAVDERYELAITAESLADLDPNDPEKGTLIKPVFTFKEASGKLLGIFTADSAQWLPEPKRPKEYRWSLKNGRVFYPSDLSPAEMILRQSGHWMDYMPTGKLIELLNMGRLPDPRSAEMLKHARFTDPINVLLMLLLGLPFILSRERNIKASAGLCVLVLSSFWAFIYACRYVDLPPIWAAWLPILVFGGVAVVMFDSVKT